MVPSNERGDGFLDEERDVNAHGKANGAETCELQVDLQDQGRYSGCGKA